VVGAAELGTNGRGAWLFERDGQWFAREQSLGVLLVNGEPGERGLEDSLERTDVDLNAAFAVREGDELVVPGLTYVFRRELRRFHRSPELEAAIFEDPDDEGCRRVYRDFLLDQGDELGDARPLAADWLEVLEARDAFIRAARIRGGFGAVPGDVHTALKCLSEHPSARFLERLELDCLTWRTENPLEPAVTALGQVSFPALRELQLGPFWVGARPKVELLEAARWRATLPRLKATSRECVVVCYRPRLQPEGDFEHFGIAQRNHAWSIESEGTTFYPGIVQVRERQVHVNGRLVRGVLNLRDRDQVALGSETATFRAQVDPL
jgi:hypothetical protein